MSNAAYYQKNRARLLAKQTAYYWQNKEVLCERGRERRKQNRSKAAKQGIATRLRHLERYILRSARYRARKKNIPFSITVKDIHIPSRCPVLGISLRSNLGNKKPGRDSPSLDRIDSSKGYVPGNVMVISWRANDVKGNGTIEELRRVADWMEMDAYQRD